MVLFQTGFKPFQLFVVLFSLREESWWFPVMRTMLLSWASQPLRSVRAVSGGCCRARVFNRSWGSAQEGHSTKQSTWGSCGSQRQPQVVPTGTGAVKSEGSACDHSVWSKPITNIPGNSSCLAFKQHQEHSEFVKGTAGPARCQGCSPHCG